MDEEEKRKKRLEELKQQSADLEKEAIEREKRNEERKKAREEQAKLLAEQEKKEEDERQKKREERKRLREEEEKKFNEELQRLEVEKQNRLAGITSSTSSSSVSLNSNNSSSSTTPSISSSGSLSSTSLESDPDIKKYEEEREKRQAERKRLREEAQKQLELEEKRIAEEREKRREDRKTQMEKDSKNIHDILISAKQNSSTNLTENIGSEKQLNKQSDQNEEQERLEKERIEKERLEKEKLENEKTEQERLENERLEKEEAEKERSEKERLENERLEKEKLEKAEQETLERERLEKEKAEKERLENERLDKEKAEKERLENERLEKERLEKERLENERLEKEKAEKERLEKEKLEKERLDKEKAEQETLEKEKAEKDRLENERLDKEKAEKEKVEKERLENERLDKEKAEKERLENERLEKERLENERLEKEGVEKERLEKERLEKERLEKEQVESERLEKEKAEKERLERDRVEKEKVEKERLENERLEKEKAEKERLDKERLEKEKVEQETKEKAEKERLDKERLDKEKVEKDRLENERLDKEKAEKERLEKEKVEKERLEKERLEKEKVEKERLEKERLEKEKVEKERLEKEKAEKERLGKEKESIEEKSKITDSFKASIEKQLQNQLAGKDSPISSPSTSSTQHSGLVNLTLDRPKMKGRNLPSKNHKAPGSSSPSTSSNASSSNSGSVLSQALDNPIVQSSNSPEVKKKIVLPPGAGGLLGGMAALALEAQKKKLEKDNKLLSAIKNEDAPSFVRGRSQSVSVTSTMKTDNGGKFLIHKKALDTYSGQRIRLIHCKGKKRILTKEVEVSINSLNKTDSFVLDCGIDGSNVGGESQDSNAHSTIYIFYGSKSTPNKKSKAVGIAEIIKSHERGGHATIIKIDEGDKEDRFYSILKGSHTSSINSDGGDDLEAETHWSQSFTLSKYDANNQSFTQIDTKSLSMEHLSSESHYILDTVSEFYEWSGRDADISTKDTFHEKAQERLKSSSHRQSWVSSVVLSEGGETVLFREKFFDWPDLSHEVSLARMGFGKKKAFDVSIPYEKKSPAKLNQFEAREMISLERAEEVMKSDGKGEFEIWHIDQMKMYPLPKEEYGQFYSAQCYIIRFTYTKWNALKYIIYDWQGCDATRQDVGASSLLIKDLYIETSNRGECTLEVERMGRESTHFLYIFNGKMIVHRGLRGEFDLSSKRLYHVFGRTNETIVSVQCTKVASTQMNSRDIFIASSGQTTYLWEGKGATSSFKTQANSIISQFFNNKASLVKEGSEPDDFWKFIGASQQHKYANFAYLEKPFEKNFQSEIKLFAVTNTGTIIRADEIFRYSQYDLNPNKVFILDNKINVYVWSGSRSKEKEKKCGTEIAIDYIKLLSDNRSENDVLFITEKDEPLSFTCYFHAWDTFRFLSSNGADEDEPVLSPKVENAVNFLKKYYQTVPYEQLTQKNTPPEIDRSVLELYLSDDEFQIHLGMTKAEWEVFPAWKKTEKKKTSGLF